MASVTTNSSMVITNNNTVMVNSSMDNNNIRTTNSNTANSIHTIKTVVATVATAAVTVSHNSAMATTQCNQVTQMRVDIAKGKTVLVTYFMINTVKPFSVSRVNS